MGRSRALGGVLKRAVALRCACGLVDGHRGYGPLCDVGAPTGALSGLKGMRAGGCGMRLWCSALRSLSKSPSGAVAASWQQPAKVVLETTRRVVEGS